jgi:hypothetical protein
VIHKRQIHKKFTLPGQIYVKNYSTEFKEDI